MKTLKLTAIAATVALASTASFAGTITDSGKTLFETATHPASISAEVGTLGYGANIAWSANEYTEVQAGWNGMEFDGDTELNADDSWINYDKVLGDGYDNFKGDLEYDVKFSNPYLAVQTHPMRNWLTVGAGVIAQNNQIDAKVTSTDGGRSVITIDGETYTLGQGSSVAIKAENKNKLAPFATIGFRPNVNDRFGLFGEVGAAYTGDYKAKADVTSTNLTTEREEELEDKLANDFESHMEWYPIAKVGATVRF